MGSNEFRFCMYCGAKLNHGDHFCGKCGVKVGETDKVERTIKEIFPQYKTSLIELKQEFEFKESKAKELIEKLFDTSKISYSKFNSSLTSLDKLFHEQYDIARNILDLSSRESEKIENELKNKFDLLESIIGKLNDLIDELVINLSSSKDNTDEIHAVFDDMDELINSVKYYD